MKVGLANAVRIHPDDPYEAEKVYADYVEDCLLAEELGYDFAWFGEHHFTPCRWTPSPIVVATAVAAQTKTLRVGTQVLCLPFHDPLRVAEDVAVADLLSGGRFDFGIGVGSQYEEFRTWGVPPKERFGRTWESIDLIERCWREDGTFSHHGKYYDFPDISFTTKPLQDPMPVWVGAVGPQSIAKTAKRGFHLMAFNGYQYDAELTKAGRNPSEFYVAPMNQISMAETTEEAWADARRGFHYFANFYQLRRDLEGVLPDRKYEATEEMLRERKAGPWNPIHGNPDDVRPHIEAIVRGDAGRATHLPLGFRHAGMTTKATHRSMRMFAEEFLPMLHAEQPAIA